MKNLQGSPNKLTIHNTNTLHEDLLQGLLTAISVIGLLIASIGSYEAFQNSDQWLIPIYWVSYLTVLLFTFWKKPGYRIRGGSLIVLVYIIALTDIMADGLGGSGRVFLVGLIFITSILFERNESIFMLLVSTLTMLAFSIIFTIGIANIPGDSRSSQLAAWIISTLSLLMIEILIVISLNYLIPRFVTALQQSQQLASELEISQTTLTQQIDERTERISKRSAQLEAITFIGRDVMSIQNLDQMLNEAVDLISDQLGYYFAGIYLTDEVNQYANLRAASSQGGHRLLISRYRVYIGETNFIGSVISRGTLRVRHYEEHEVEILETPELAETRSEIVLPLRARDQLIGALDIQSHEIEEFDEENIKMLQILADQLALSITNARLYQETQQSLESARRAYGQISQQAWTDLISRQQIIKRYDPQEILSEDNGWSKKSLQATQDGKMVIEDNMLAIPIKERGQVIGLIRAHKDSEKELWTQEEINLINSLTDQLEVALESARLYKDTQLLAEQERLVGEITSQMRQSLDIESVLKTAVKEIRSALDIPKVTIRLKPNIESKELE
jgi:GAF domain-containing protein